MHENPCPPERPKKTYRISSSHQLASSPRLVKVLITKKGTYLVEALKQSPEEDPEESPVQSRSRGAMASTVSSRSRCRL
ncbi:hypothetical protein L596_027924 [Steinernema carpocapsae]|uniref:Uncharacterized protein n=1 Tax=Steinernema carpocapsae TaxID=34508 RepID=A0A4U5LWX7_STECR|nr:hypothetical protein L596_027924 [Steinernema carpocapsae]